MEVVSVRKEAENRKAEMICEISISTFSCRELFKTIFCFAPLLVMSHRKWRIVQKCMSAKSLASKVGGGGVPKGPGSLSEDRNRLSQESGHRGSDREQELI